MARNRALAIASLSSAGLRSSLMRESTVAGEPRRVFRILEYTWGVVEWLSLFDVSVFVFVFVFVFMFGVEYLRNTLLWVLRMCNCSMALQLAFVLVAVVGWEETDRLPIWDKPNFAFETADDDDDDDDVKSLILAGAVFVEFGKEKKNTRQQPLTLDPLMYHSLFTKFTPSFTHITSPLHYYAHTHSTTLPTTSLLHAKENKTPNPNTPITPSNTK
jgi:hypothetical protein